MAFMLLAALGVAAMNACVRHVSNELHPFEIAFFRSLFGLAVLAPVFLRVGFAPLRTRKLHVHAVRGALIAASMMTGLSLVPLAKFTALFFSAPLFGTVLAWIALREMVRLPRLVALAVGLAGTLIILRPGGTGYDPGTVLVVLAAALWGVGMIVIKVFAANRKQRDDHILRLSLRHPDRVRGGASVLADADDRTARLARPHRRVRYHSPHESRAGVPRRRRDRGDADRVHEADLGVRDRFRRLRRNTRSVDLGRRGA